MRRYQCTRNHFDFWLINNWVCNHQQWKVTAQELLDEAGRLWEGFILVIPHVAIFVESVKLHIWCWYIHFFFTPPLSLSKPRKCLGEFQHQNPPSAFCHYCVLQITHMTYMVSTTIRIHWKSWSFHQNLSNIQKSMGKHIKLSLKKTPSSFNLNQGTPPKAPKNSTRRTMLHKLSPWQTLVRFKEPYYYINNENLKLHVELGSTTV